MCLTTEYRYTEPPLDAYAAVIRHMPPLSSLFRACSDMMINSCRPNAKPPPPPLTLRQHGDYDAVYFRGRSYVKTTIFNSQMH